MPFDRRRFLLGIAVAACAGPALAQGAGEAPAEDEATLIARATSYLEGLHTAKARFVQTDSRGQTTTGTVYLKRPGKARFAYDPPSGLLVVSNGSVVSVADSRLKTFDSYPLGMTPLSLFLARNIRLSSGVRVTNVARTADGFTLTARDGRKKTAGRITLAFADAPLRLVGWTVTDAQGRATHVQLADLSEPGALDPALFVLKNPWPQRAARPGL